MEKNGKAAVPALVSGEACPLVTSRSRSGTRQPAGGASACP